MRGACRGLSVLAILMIVFSLPVSAQQDSLKAEFDRAQRYALILWLATDERLYPMMPHPFAFDAIDNDGDGGFDLEDEDEVIMGTLDLDGLQELVEALRGLDFSFHYSEEELKEYLANVEVPSSGKQVQTHLYRRDLAEGPVSDAFRERLEGKGVTLSDSALITMETEWSGKITDVLSIVTDSKNTIEIKLEYAIRVVEASTLSDRESQLSISRENRLPPPRVMYYLSDERVRETNVYQYWFYYLFDEGTGGHEHDGEHAFLFVDQYGEVVAVVGAGHTEATVNNILVRGSKRSGRGFPEELPQHMPILVELGKHPSAPDRSFDGRFDAGIDANVFYRDVWGSRDVATVSEVDPLDEFNLEYSFPRDATTLLLERKWSELWIEHHAPKSDSTKTVLPRAGASAQLAAVEAAQLERFEPPVTSKFGPGAEIYELLPLNEMEELYRILDEETPAPEDIETWLTDRKRFFWGADRVPDTVKVTAEACSLMKEWPKHKHRNRDLWLHKDYGEPEDVFKMWLFPRLALGGGYVFESGDHIVRGAVHLANLGTIKIPFLGAKPVLKYTTMELHASYDLSNSDMTDIGLMFSYFRARHQGWYTGVAWGDVGHNDHAALTVGFVPASFYVGAGLLNRIWFIGPILDSIIGRTRVVPRFGLRGGDTRQGASTRTSQV